ncbi:MAG: hypothetical protein ABJF23_09025 [Bryobacteraceae bacterium]
MKVTPRAYIFGLSFFLCACGMKEETAVIPPPVAQDGPPVAVSVSPSSGSGSAQDFTIKFSRPGGYRQLSDIRLLINAEADGAHACYVYYSVPTGSVMLVNDSGEGSTAVALEGGAAVENSQCTVLTKGASAKGEGTDISVTLPIRFKPKFAGAKKLFLYAEAANGAKSDMVAKGVFEPTAAAATAK